MCANMLRAFQVGKALASHEGPCSWMLPSRLAWAQGSWPACRAAHDLPRRVVADLPLDAAQRARYIGNYDMGQRQVRIFEREGVLMAQPTGQTAVRMRYQGEQTFQLDAPQAIRLVFDADGNRAPAFTLHQGAGAVRATRIPDSDTR